MTTIRFEGRMSDQDALMWAIEKDPLLRSTITSVTLFDAGLVRPVIDRRFGLADMAAAHDHLESNANVGKVLIDVG